jgi:hypothetical protein
LLSIAHDIAEVRLIHSLPSRPWDVQFIVAGIWFDGLNKHKIQPFNVFRTDSAESTTPVSFYGDSDLSDSAASTTPLSHDSTAI